MQVQKVKGSCSDKDSATAHFVSVRGGIKNRRQLASRSGKELLQSGYKEAAQYFQQRVRPPRHFLDSGVGVTPIAFYYPPHIFNLKHSLLFYLNYRTRSQRFKKLSFIFLSLEYQPDFTSEDDLIKEDLITNKGEEEDVGDDLLDNLVGDSRHRLSLLTGIRYPSSSDLRRFYVDFLLGVSGSLRDFSFSDMPLELRLLFTHIISPSDFPIRFYLQWGVPVRWRYNLFEVDLQKRFLYSLTIRAGLDFHL